MKLQSAVEMNSAKPGYVPKWSLFAKQLVPILSKMDRIIMDESMIGSIDDLHQARMLFEVINDAILDRDRPRLVQLMASGREIVERTIEVFRHTRECMP